MQVGPCFQFPLEKVTAFCAKWKVRELSVFGSALRTDFGPDSDVDLLVSFHKHAEWSLWDLFDMRDELTMILGREVDLIEKEGLRNPFRRYEILTTRQVLYAA